MDSQPRCKLAVTAAVETVSVVAAAAVPGFSTAGVNEQDEPLGKLAHAKETLLTGPGLGVTATW
jgi:hypothetical protein